MLASGTTVGRYLILDQLGEGAMGEVYRSWDNALDRVVALKIMLPLRADSPAARKRFEREARLSARINHPCVAHVYDVGEFDDSPFIAMEFVPGRQLRDEMHEPVLPERVVFLARQILEGLAEAHRQGVVHRDLKPENILISGRDQVKILDFGLAKPINDEISEATDLSTTGLTGTPRYMAPEQIQGHTVDPRTDLYALGAILYELLTAHPAHSGTTLGEMLMAIVHKPAPELTDDICPRPLAQAIKRALMKKPEERFQSAEMMLSSLADIDGNEGELRSGRAEHHVPHPRAEMYTKRARESLTGIGTSSGLATDMLDQAIELDPDYALAHAIHAEACAAAFMTGHVDARWIDRAQASLDRAEALDPTLPDLRVARARLIWNKTFNFPAETALRELKLALRKDPEHQGALRAFATITGHVGLFEHTEIALSKLRTIAPRDPVVIAVGASSQIFRGRADAAIHELDPVLRLDPRHEEVTFWWIYGHALVVLGKTDQADMTVRDVLKRHPQDPLALSLAALVRAARGDAKSARTFARSVERCLKGELHPHHAYHLLACAESLLGDAEASRGWLVRCADEGLPCYPWFERDPLLETLRKDEQGAAYLSGLQRRYQYFEREFPLIDRGTTLSYVATEVPNDR